MQPALEMRGIVKRFPGVLANNHASLELMPGEVHALLGENGAGKSTLMQILYGSYGADAGEILLDGRPVAFASQREAIRSGIGMIHQDFMLVRRFRVVENVVLGLEGERGMVDLGSAAERVKAISERHHLGVDPWALIEGLPVGVQQRVEIVKLLYRDARILILDEPTAVLTPQETGKLLATLRALAADGRSVIIVTHKLHEIIEVADRITIMRDGRTVATVRTAETDEAELARLMVGRDVLLKVSRPAQRRGEPVLAIRGLHVADDRGAPAVRGVDLTVHAGEIVGVAGVDGNGQSQLVEAVMGLRPATGGEVTLAGETITAASPAERGDRGMAYVPADRRGVGSVATLGIDDNAILGGQRRFTRFGAIFRDRRRIARHAETLVARFGVRTPDVRFHAGQLSGGNLQKLILGREIMRDPLALVVEQPTRGLDVGAIEGVWAEILAVRSQGKAILMVSAELEEIRNLADRIVVLHAGAVMGELDPEEASDELLGLMMAGMMQPAARALLEGARAHAV
jgi:simple sugar transport system ATP-binding protein